MSLYLYCVMADPGDRVIAARGLHGTALTAVRHDGLAMIVGPSVEEEYGITSEETRAHYAALQTLLADAPLLPVRYGTTARGEEEIVGRVLRPRADEFRKLLSWIGDKEEVGFKLRWRTMEPVFQQIRASSPKLLQLASRISRKDPDASYFERIEAGRLVRDLLAAHRDSLRRRILDRLRAEAVDCVEGAPYGEEMVAHADFLLSKAGTEAFERAIQQVQFELADNGVVRTLRNCVPYNFIKITIELD